jgi:outer membrane protein OmpA-like peptidoglycan-associated protein
VAATRPTVTALQGSRPRAAAQVISEIARILALFQQTTIIVTGYTDNDATSR